MPAARVYAPVMADLTALIGNADAFPVLRRWTFLNHAGVSPSPKVVGDAMRQFVDASEAGAYLDADWWPHLERVRAAAAALSGAEVGEVALAKPPMCCACGSCRATKLTPSWSPRVCRRMAAPAACLQPMAATQQTVCSQFPQFLRGLCCTWNASIKCC